MNGRYDLLFKKPVFQDIRQRTMSRIANSLLKNVELDRLKVKHLEILSRNTLTCPKVSLVESGTDPTANGIMTMNGGIIRGQSNGVVKNFGGVLGNDASQLVGGTSANASNGNGIDSTAAGLASQSVTVTPSSTPNYVYVVGSFTYANVVGNTSVTFNILKGATVVATVTKATTFRQVWSVVLDYLDINITNQAYSAQITGYNAGSDAAIAGIAAKTFHL